MPETPICHGALARLASQKSVCVMFDSAQNKLIRRNTLAHHDKALSAEETHRSTPMTQHMQFITPTFTHPSDAENALIDFIEHGLPNKRPHSFVCDEAPSSSEQNQTPDFQKTAMNWGGLL
jgi:hypothetical protein